MCELTLGEAGFTPAEVAAMAQAREEAEMAQLRAVIDSDATTFAEKLDAFERAGELVTRAADRALEAWRRA